MIKQGTGINKITSIKLLRASVHNMLVDCGYIATRSELSRLLHERVDKLEYNQLEAFYNDLASAILDKNIIDYKATNLILNILEEDLKNEH